MKQIWCLTLAMHVAFSFLMKFVMVSGMLLLAWMPVVPVRRQEKTVAPDFAWLAHDPNYSDVSDILNIRTDLRYGSENNFLGKNLYGDFNRCFLHRVAAEKLRRAAGALAVTRPGWKLLIFDCLRPRSLQEKLFASVKGTSRQPYVANPRTGSIHNYGLAVDLSLEDEHGHEVDMGTKFDDFTPLAQPAQERANLAAGKLSREQVERRLLLRKIMTQAGFVQLPIEWWHYDALLKEEVRKIFKIVE
jgi:D-alanyl-D-alanine dipeptidase